MIGPINTFNGQPGFASYNTFARTYLEDFMPKFTIDHDSSHDSQETYKKVKEFLGKDQDIRRFDPKLQCQFDDAKQTCKINGSQFKADAQIAASGAGSKITITVDLPLMLTPFKGKVQEMLKSKLSKYLG